MFSLLKDDTPKDETFTLYSTALKNIEDVWQDIFKQQGVKYKSPTLVLYDNDIKTPVGKRTKTDLPVYTPQNKKIYLSPLFDQYLKERIKDAPAVNYDFARACVVAHEVGHHIQTVTHTMPEIKVKEWYSRLSRIKRAKIDQKIELDADYLTGIWAHHAHKDYNLLENGDIETAQKLFFHLGIDEQEDSQNIGSIPRAFGYGIPEQRKKAFSQGYKDGSSNIDLNVDPCSSPTKSIILREPVGG